MELKLKFNEDAANYDRWRPTYVPQLFNNILKYSDLSENKRTLEIGIGTGQATLPILKTNCHVTAIEIGDRLATYAKRKFTAYKNIEIKTIAFEDYACKDNSFDLVYSATAFHWIPQRIGYPKVYQLLKSGGVLALFWNHPFVARNDDPLHMKIQRIYDKYRPSNQKPLEFDKEKCLERANIIEQYGFIDIDWNLYNRTRTFDAKSYVSLLNTYSDHRAMPEKEKLPFEDEIMETINCFGGKLNIYDTMDLYLAKKP